MTKKIPKGCAVWILLGQRLNESSTELFMEVEKLEEPFFFLELYRTEMTEKGRIGILIGYLKYQLVSVGVSGPSLKPKISTYVLTQLLSEYSPHPHPIISMSDVLYPRRVMLEVHQSEIVSPTVEGRMP